jgi:hypothetical protein
MQDMSWFYFINSFVFIVLLFIYIFYLSFKKKWHSNQIKFGMRFASITCMIFIIIGFPVIVFLASMLEYWPTMTLVKFLLFIKDFVEGFAPVFIIALIIIVLMFLLGMLFGSYRKSN